MDVGTYLKRLQVNKPSDPNLSYLTHLQYQHMLTVPFENLDVMHQVPISLHLEKFYEKVVLRQRGGFCYELNGLFQWLLQQLGYDVYFISGTVQKPDGTWALADSHATNIVRLDQPYLVDVGFGDSIRIPIPLTGEEIEDGSDLYRVSQSGQDENSTYHFQRKKDDRWITLYRFHDQPKALSDFTPMCHYNQTSPESRFTQESIVTIATDDGRITLLNDKLIMKKGWSKREQAITEHKKANILRHYFGIVMNDVE